VLTVPAGGTYSHPQTLLLDLSGPLGREGKATWRGKRRKERKGGIGKRGVAYASLVALASRKKFPRAPLHAIMRANSNLTRQL